MRSFFIYILNTILFSSLFVQVFAQTIQNNPTINSDTNNQSPLVFTPSNIPQEAQGLWQNNNKIISFDTENTLAFKSFYRFFYDGSYPLHKTSNTIFLALYNNSLYTSFWQGRLIESHSNTSDQPYDTPQIKTRGMFYIPLNHMHELKIAPAYSENHIIAFYNEQNTWYAIPYWEIHSDNGLDKTQQARLSPENAPFESVFIDKYITISNVTYTCAEGLRDYVRNPQKLETLPDNLWLSNDKSIIFRGNPYLTRLPLDGETSQESVAISEQSLPKLIEAHNNIPRPWRLGRARFEEPSIYKKLREMNIPE